MGLLDDAKIAMGLGKAKVVEEPKPKVKKKLLQKKANLGLVL